MDEIKLPNELTNTKFIYDKFRQFFDAAVAAWDVAVRFLPEEGTIGVGKTRIFNLCMLAIHAKQLRLFVANYRLCRSGLGLEGLSVVRTMFETFIHLKTLKEFENPENYARLWMIWCVANNEKMARRIIDQYPTYKEAFIDLQHGLEEEKKKFNPDEWKNFVWRGPLRLNMEKLSQAVGLQEAYKAFYPLASSVHGYDLMAYAKFVSGDHIQPNLSPSLDVVDSNLGSSVNLLQESFELFNSLLDLKKETEVETLKQIVQKVRSYKTGVPD